MFKEWEIGAIQNASKNCFRNVAKQHRPCWTSIVQRGLTELRDETVDH